MLSAIQNRRSIRRFLDRPVPREAVEAVLLGETKVVYHIGEKKDYIPGSYQVTECTLKYHDNSILHMERAQINGKLARDVRDGMVREIHITLC